MARIFVDGIETGALDQWDGIGGTNVTASTTRVAGSWSTYSLRAASPNGAWSNYAIKNIPSGDTIYFKFRFSFDPSVGFQSSIAFYNASGVQVSVGLNATTKKLQVFRGLSNGTLLGTGNTALVENLWYLVEGKVYIHPTDGIIELRLNGLTELSLTGQNTRNQATTDMTAVYLGYIGYATSYSGGQPYYFDDIVFDDSSWIGNSKIQAIVPNGAGNSTQWTPSTGSNYACVDEIPASSTDYVSINSTDQVDLYAASGLLFTPESVQSVQLHASAILNGDPSVKQLQVGGRSGLTNFFSTSIPISNTIPKSATQLFTTNPVTGLAWTPDEVANLEIGFKSIT